MLLELLVQRQNNIHNLHHNKQHYLRYEDQFTDLIIRIACLLKKMTKIALE